MLKKIVTKTGGHPLSIEILAKTYEGGGETELDEISIHWEKKGKIFPQQKNVYNLYRIVLNIQLINSDPNIQKLLPLLTIFHSPFPSDVIEKVFNKETKEKIFLLELYNKSLLIRIEADQYGPISDDGFWLYSLHPALRNYLEDKYK